MAEPSEPVKSKGTTSQHFVLGYADSAAGPFTPLCQMTNVTEGDQTVKDESITNLDSVMEESNPGLPSVSDLSGDAVYRGDKYAIIQGLKFVPKFWSAVDADGGTSKFEGYINKVGGRQVKQGSSITCSLGIKYTTLPVFTAAG